MTATTSPAMMRTLPDVISWAKALSILLGVAVIGLAVGTAMTGKPLGQIIANCVLFSVAGLGVKSSPQTA